MQQHAAWCLVDVLAGGDQADAEVIEALVEDDVVGAVSRQAVQFVDDDVVDGLAVSAGVLEVAQHRLEGWAPGRGARDAALDELFGDDRPDRLGLALVGGPLDGDGEALLPPTTLSLLAGRYPQVGHGALGHELAGQEPDRLCCRCRQRLRFHTSIDTLLGRIVQGVTRFSRRRSIEPGSRMPLRRLRSVNVVGILRHTAPPLTYSLLGGPPVMVSAIC